MRFMSGSSFLGLAGVLFSVGFGLEAEARHSTYSDPREIPADGSGQMPFFDGNGDPNSAALDGYDSNGASSEMRFHGFETDSMKVPAWTLSSSYSILSLEPKCDDCGSSISGPGLSISYGARSPTEHTGLGGILGYRRFGDGARLSGWDLSAGIDSIAYLGGEPGKGRGWFLRAVIAGDYSRFRWAPAQADSNSGNGTQNGPTGRTPDDGSDEIRAYSRITHGAAVESVSKYDEGSSGSLGALGRFGVGYDVQIRTWVGSGTLFYERIQSKGGALNGVTFMLGLSF